MALLYERETWLLRRGFYEVHNEVGLGRDEEDYHQALKLWLSHHQVPFASKQPHSLLLDNQVAHKLFPDFVAWDMITIELKARPRNLQAADYVQLFDYLKRRGDRLGLLVNMGLDRVQIERVAFEPRSTELQEDWAYWSESIDGAARDIGKTVCAALRRVYNQHSSGYGDEVLRKLIGFAAQNEGLRFETKPFAPARFAGVTVGHTPLDCLIVDKCIVVTFSSLFHNNDWNINRCRSYLTALNHQWGIAANFGRETVQFAGVRRQDVE